MNFSEEDFEEILERFYEKEEYKDIWKPQPKKSGNITVWSTETGPETFGLKRWVKFETIFDISMDQLIRVLKEGMFKYSADHKSVRNFDLVEKDENSDLLLFVVGIPVPFSSWRYSLIRRRWKRTEDNVFYMVDRTVPEEKRNLDVSGYVHLKSFEIRKLEALEDGRTKLSGYNVHDVGGNLQKINFVISKLGGFEGLFLKRLEEEKDLWTGFSKKLEEGDDEEEATEGEK